MKEKIKKIKNKATSTPCKYIIIFLVVFFIVSFVSYVFILDLEHKVNDQNIQYIECNVTDKYITNEPMPKYIIIGDNHTYEMLDDKKGKEMFKDIDIGNRYQFIIRQPNHNNDNILIIQVYNETGGHSL